MHAIWHKIVSSFVLVCVIIDFLFFNHKNYFLRLSRPKKNILLNSFLVNKKKNKQKKNAKLENFFERNCWREEEALYDTVQSRTDNHEIFFYRFEKNDQIYKIMFCCSAIMSYRFQSEIKCYFEIIRSFQVVLPGDKPVVECQFNLFITKKY